MIDVSSRICSLYVPAVYFLDFLVFAYNKIMLAIVRATPKFKSEGNIVIIIDSIEKNYLGDKSENTGSLECACPFLARLILAFVARFSFFWRGSTWQQY